MCIRDRFKVLENASFEFLTLLLGRKYSSTYSINEPLPNGNLPKRSLVKFSPTVIGLPSSSKWIAQVNNNIESSQVNSCSINGSVRPC